MAAAIQISEAFVVNHHHHAVGGTLGHKVTTSSTRFHAASSSSENNDQAKGGGEGGTEWIKIAMGTANSNNDAPSSNTPPPPPPSAPYTEDEIKTMENLILELSLEKDDTIRRAKLSAIFDKVFELDVDTTTTTDANTVDGGNAVSSSDGSSSSNEGERREAPRFAQLFQYSLDNVGELVQCAAREKAELLNNSNNSNGDNGTDATQEGNSSNGEEDLDSTSTEGRVKSEEELQLWALIDMMVQSKTMVKMHMGSLGSKGVFR